MAKIVRQRNCNDCAVACLASVLERPYEEVMSKVLSLGLVKTESNAYLSFDDMKKVLSKYRVKSKFSNRGFDPAYPAILMFSWSGNPRARSDLHCNVYDPEGVRLLDPCSGLPLSWNIKSRMRVWKSSGMDSLVVYV